MNDLNAFFAKKASKGKKKGVIKLQEISDQLERRAMEQRDETEDSENKTTEDTNSKNRPIIDNGEDSEWLGFDDRPSVPVAIKEMADSYVEYNDVEKGASVEPAKTWKTTNNDDIADVAVVAIKSEPAKYVVKAKKAAQLDLTNDEMFPSIEKAPEVEQKLKELEEINRRTKLEERKQQEEKEREESARRASAYKPPRRTADGEHPRMQERRQQQDDEPTESETLSNWRDMQRVVPKEEEKEKPMTRGGTTTGHGHQIGVAVKPVGEVEMNWRSKPAEPAGVADSQDNWRTNARPSTTLSQKPAPIPQAPAAVHQQAPTKGAYVPPHMRKKMEEGRT